MSRLSPDELSERIARGLARAVSRRSTLASLGRSLVAGAAFPVLPVARAAAAGKTPLNDKLTDFERNAQTSDPARCDYWRHCAIDGVLCGCCGGGTHTCPPGTEPSPISWIGTCRNPADSKYYVVAYRDCCGRATCDAGKDCHCNTSDRELPIYRPSNSNDIIWCFGKASSSYHCSTAALLGPAD